MYRAASALPGAIGARSWFAACTLALGVLAALAGLAPAGAAMAAEWPSKSLRFVVPYPPGGPLDIMARVLADKVREPLGQAIVVENRPGAGGSIGADIVAKADPDGYTLLMGGVASQAINPWLLPNIGYDPIRDFAPITLVADVPNVLIVNQAFAQKNSIASVGDLVAYGKRNPDRLNYSSGSNGSPGHLAGELLNEEAGIAAQHIPYQGAAPAQLALLAGEVNFMFDNLASAAALIRDGKVKALAITTLARASLLPDVPTMNEAGIKGFDLGTWFGVFATGGTPGNVVARLNQLYTAALRDPEVRKRLSNMGSDAPPNAPPEFAEKVRKDLDKYKEIVKRSGANPN